MPLFKLLLQRVISLSGEDRQWSAGPQVEPLEERRMYASHVKYVPKFSHVVVVMEENQAEDEVIGNSQLSYFNVLANGGADFTNSFAETHPSQPNYLALFSGSTQGVTTDDPSGPFSDSNLAEALIAKGQTYATYADALPFDGYTGSDSGEYVTKHDPASDFTNIPSSTHLTFNDFPQTAAGFANLPTVSFVIPDLLHDMHDGSPLEANNWLKLNLGAYARWATANNSLLIISWDEDDNTSVNRIPTIFYGANVKTDVYTETIDHYNVLRTIEDMYGLSHFGYSGEYGDIRDCWTNPPPATKATVVNAAAQPRAAEVTELAAAAPQKQIDDLKSLLDD